MSNRQPNFIVGDKVRYDGYIGVIEKINTIGPSKYSYKVKLPHNTVIVAEGKLRRV
jgi:hypothetical protein